jgi:hypothetical protein
MTGDVDPTFDWLVFYFNFYNEDKDEETNYGFLCKVDKHLDVDKFVQSFEYDTALDIMENNGVHDWSTHPVDGCKAIGYTTYEIDDPVTLMEEWRRKFEQIPGIYWVEKVQQLDENDTFNDLTVQQALLKKLANIP